MSKTKKIFVTALVALCLGVSLTPSVSAYYSLKSYKYDVNRFTGVIGNYHDHYYTYVPSWSRFLYNAKYPVGYGWNYIRYVEINYYSGGY